MAKQKFYVVWKGVNPGIYSSWTDCQLQIQGYKGAIYKSFDSQEEAEHAFATPAYQYMNRHRASSSEKTEVQLPENFNLNCLAVDAACSGNPGPMEYRGANHLAEQLNKDGIPADRTGNLPFRTGLRNQQYRRIPGHRSRTGTS